MITFYDLSLEKQEDLAQKFFKEKDTYAYEDDGQPVKEFLDWLKEENYIEVAQ